MGKSNNSVLEGETQNKGGSFQQPDYLQDKILNVCFCFTTIGFLVLYYKGFAPLYMFQLSFMVTAGNIIIDLYKEKGE